ncbi:hypothetical protein BAE44_0021551 [Dichanthelium oligosanthes]|uniref:Disease resistance R13L4/SHOC-2-like LRR domain-containing protein n=1 Tax=Dichanthelium oligosanthes TaxID=888268 RepID=A0A1E5UX48_9POAL|nr:hypothetical protein BAE44_0021551 [Dichanthelium oligosanthes]
MKDHHLASIEKLFHLKYLCLSSSSIHKLPEKIGELQYLETLDVRYTAIKELPSTITKLQRLAHLYVGRDVRFPDGTIGQMHSLEELKEYGVHSCEQGKSLQEFSKLTKLRTLKIRLVFYFLRVDWQTNQVSVDKARQAEDWYSYVGTLLSSCDLHNLYIEGSDYPLSLDSWLPPAPCSLRKLCIKNPPVYKVPNWMGSLGNLVVLELVMLCVRPEDVEILGAIPSLLFLEIATAGGTNGRITVHGSNGFRSLKYFSLEIYSCGTALEFQVGSMPNLEHVRLKFPAHKSRCLNNGASSLGIQHLSAISKVEVIIHGNCESDDSNYDPTEDENDGAVRGVARAINGAIMTLPNRPTVTFVTGGWCVRFERVSFV